MLMNDLHSSHIRWRLVAKMLIALLAASLLLASATVAPARAAGWTVYFEAGPHIGYRFSSTGATIATKSATLIRPSSAPAVERRSITGRRGTFLRISAGIWAGYWLPESRMAHIAGIVGLRTLSPAWTVTFPAGRYEAYRFDAGGAMTDARATLLPRASSAHAGTVAVIDGRPFFRMTDGMWAGWWLPGGVAAPEPIRCVAGPRVAPATNVVVRSVPSATGRIALTFDMGGRLDPALRIVRTLVLERVCATIFSTGEAATTTTGRQVMAIVKAHPELFEVGNHTMNHCNLRDGGPAGCPPTRPSDAFARKELTDADAVIAPLAGAHTAPLWRPPYGAVDTRLVSVAGSVGYRLTAMWSIDTIDWRPLSQSGPTAWGISSKILANRTPGAIVLMHLGGYNTAESLAATLDGLLRAGYRPTTISGLYR